MCEGGLMRVALVVDDNDLSQALLKRILEGLDLSVIVTSNAHDGIRLAREINPAIIFMDVHLPGAGLDGLAATRALKDDPSTQQIPVVVMTAGACPDESAGCKESRGDAFFRKPFSVQSLIQCIQALT